MQEELASLETHNSTISALKQRNGELEEKKEHAARVFDGHADNIRRALNDNNGGGDGEGGGEEKGGDGVTIETATRLLSELRTRLGSEHREGNTRLQKTKTDLATTNANLQVRNNLLTPL